MATKERRICKKPNTSGPRGRLCITRRDGEAVYIGDTLVRLEHARGDRARLIIEAPHDVAIIREELVPKLAS